MADSARFIILVKSLGSSGGDASGGPARVAPKSAVTDFHDTLNQLAASTGTTINQSFAAQGSHDYVVDATIDPQKFAEKNPGMDVAGATAQHLAIGFAGALAKKARVTTQTLPVAPLADESFQKAFYSCTEQIAG